MSGRVYPGLLEFRKPNALFFYLNFSVVNFYGRHDILPGNIGYPFFPVFRGINSDDRTGIIYSQENRTAPGVCKCDNFFGNCVGMGFLKLKFDRAVFPLAEKGYEILSDC